MARYAPPSCEAQKAPAVEPRQYTRTDHSATDISGCHRAGAGQRTRGRRMEAGRPSTRSWGQHPRTVTCHRGPQTHHRPSALRPEHLTPPITTAKRPSQGHQTLAIPPLCTCHPIRGHRPVWACRRSSLSIRLISNRSLVPPQPPRSAPLGREARWILQSKGLLGGDPTVLWLRCGWLCASGLATRLSGLLLRRRLSRHPRAPSCNVHGGC